MESALLCDGVQVRRVTSCGGKRAAFCLDAHLSQVVQVEVVVVQARVANTAHSVQGTMEWGQSVPRAQLLIGGRVGHGVGKVVG